MVKKTQIRHHEWQQETEKKREYGANQKISDSIIFSQYIKWLSTTRDVWKYKQGTWDQRSKVKNKHFLEKKNIIIDIKSPTNISIIRLEVTEELISEPGRTKEIIQNLGQNRNIKMTEIKIYNSVIENRTGSHTWKIKQDVTYL